MDKETRKEFDNMQAVIEQPACFGKHGSDINCPHCWYHPDCINKTIKKEDKNKSKTNKNIPNTNKKGGKK